MRSACLLLIFSGFASVGLSQETRSWTGQWNNKKFGTSGKMNCVTKINSDGQWEGRFTGLFRGDPFDYTAVFQANEGRTGFAFSGDAVVRGSKYRWTGSLKGNLLRGEYTSAVGYYGEFVLKETGQNRSGPSRTTQTRNSRTVSPEPKLSGPLIRDGQRMLFVGNGFMGGEGGVDQYLLKALEKDQLTITTKEMIYPGQTLKEMLIPEVGNTLSSDEHESVVITSGDIEAMKHFEKRIKENGNITFVLMTWALRHPGNGATQQEYTQATRAAVRLMRKMEQDTSAVIVPSAVAYHDLTLRPPSGVSRVDYLWKPQDIHQNEIGTMVNAWMLYAIMMNKSPVGVNFDVPPYVVGQTLKETPEIRFTRNLRTELQERVWEVAKKWRSGQTQFD